jgi:chromosomal replication initiation ATPase DnaA
MNKIDDFIFTNFTDLIASLSSTFQPSNYPTYVNAIIVGFSGSGKTFLLNNLCGTDEPVGFAPESLT